MRLIDADKLDWWYKGRPIRRVIDEAPTVDAVPVVRCKDCKHGKVHGSYYICKNIHVGSYGWGMRKNDFCSYGERRTDERKTD